MIRRIPRLLGMTLLALADESGCTARTTLLGGEKVTVTNFGVRLTQDSSRDTQLAATYQEGQAMINIRMIERI